MLLYVVSHKLCSVKPSSYTVCNEVPMVAFKDRVEDGKTLEKRLRDEIIEPRYLLEPGFSYTRREGGRASKSRDDL